MENRKFKYKNRFLEKTEAGLRKISFYFLRVLTRGRQRDGITEYRCAVYRFCGSGNGSGIENFCGTVLRYKFLEPAVNGIGSGIDFRKKRYTVTVKVLHFSRKIPRFLQIP